jgi:hypothetical protein
MGEPVPWSTGNSKRTPERVAAYLDALRDMPLYGRAARIAGVSQNTADQWRRSDPDFRLAVREAYNEGVERIEAVAHRAALEGTDREATLQRIFVLKRHKPEYRDNVTIKHEGDAGQHARDAALLRRAMVEALGPFPEARAALAAALARLSAGSDGQLGEGPALRASLPAVIEGVCSRVAEPGAEVD